MLSLILERLALGLVTLIAASILVFAGTELLPGDLATALLQNNATPENLAAMRDKFELDRPVVERFMKWFLRALQLDFGTSLANGRPVLEDLWPRLMDSLFLAAYAAMVAIPLSLIFGLLAAIYEGSIYDRGVNVVTLVSISIPEYCWGYLLIALLAVEAGLFPPLANVRNTTPLPDRLLLTTLPMIALTLVVMAAMLRMTRASVLQIMAQPYIEMAFLKGLPKWRIVTSHALPNAIGPIASVVSLNLAYLVVGVVVVEIVFVYPGLGAKMVDAVGKRDVPMVQACGLIFAGIFIALNLLADLVAIASNPRLRHRR